MIYCLDADARRHRGSYHRRRPNRDGFRRLLGDQIRIRILCGAASPRAGASVHHRPGFVAPAIAWRSATTSLQGATDYHSAAGRTGRDCVCVRSRPNDMASSNSRVRACRQPGGETGASESSFAVTGCISTTTRSRHLRRSEALRPRRARIWTSAPISIADAARGETAARGQRGSTCRLRRDGRVELSMRSRSGGG